MREFTIPKSYGHIKAIHFHDGNLICGLEKDNSASLVLVKVNCQVNLAEILIRNYVGLSYHWTFMWFEGDLMAIIWGNIYIIRGDKAEKLSRAPVGFAECYKKLCSKRCGFSSHIAYSESYIVWAGAFKHQRQADANILRVFGADSAADRLDKITYNDLFIFNRYTQRYKVYRVPYTIPKIPAFPAISKDEMTMAVVTQKNRVVVFDVEDF